MERMLLTLMMNTGSRDCPERQMIAKKVNKKKQAGNLQALSTDTFAVSQA
jgi:hypothetical protein